jgi:hypothetical protein
MNDGEVDANFKNVYNRLDRVENKLISQDKEFTTLGIALKGLQENADKASEGFLKMMESILVPFLTASLSQQQLHAQQQTQFGHPPYGFGRWGHEYEREPSTWESVRVSFPTRFHSICPWIY